MAGFQIIDWDDAYENGGHIVDSDETKKRWPTLANNFRDQSRCQLDVSVPSEKGFYDLFLPEDIPKGLFVFVHGGYWQATDKSFWSHLARGAVDAGWACVLPGYDLCPNVGIADIVSMVASAVNHAATEIDGDVVLTGHSAGGHIVAALSAEDSELKRNVASRLRHVLPVSGLGDLRPLLKTKLNDALQLNEQTAVALSPVLKRPAPNTRLTAWVGAAERSEFIRQNRMLADMWHGLGARTQCVEEPDKHHFNVIDGLTDHNSPLMRAALSVI